MGRSRAITVIGAGNLGANIAYFLFEEGIGDCIYLYDRNDGRARGKALDMIEAQPLRRSRPTLRGSDSLDSIANSASTIIAMTADMYPELATEDERRRAIMDDLAALTPSFASYEGIVICAFLADDTEGEGVEASAMRHLAAQSSLPPTHIIGLGTVPHTLYGEYLLSKELNIDTSQIRILIGGTGNRPRLIPSAIRVAGIPLASLAAALGTLDIDGALIEKIAAFGRESGRYYYCHAAAAARIAEAIDSDMHRLLSVSSLALMEQYCAPHPLALPMPMGANGAEYTRGLGGALINAYSDQNKEARR